MSLIRFLTFNEGREKERKKTLPTMLNVYDGSFDEKKVEMYSVQNDYALYLEVEKNKCDSLKS